jgi:phenylpropionate dioxygenase-like ring-hydroxylating dioxygenase large terminal subunit
MVGVVNSPARARRSVVAQMARRRLVAHIAAGCTTDMTEVSLENDARVYTDPDRLALERREIFLKVPLVAGCSGDIPAAGDILLFDELGYSIIIVRGTDGGVRAFLNMCPHRGTRLVEPNDSHVGTGRATITCQFHAWCFDLAGMLVAMPGREGFSDMAPRRLIPVPVVEAYGLLFIALKPGGQTLTIGDHLGPFADELAQLELDHLAFSRGGSLKAACNWKLAVDTYAESYHFGVLHASTIGRTHLSNVAVFDSFGRHWRAHFAEKCLAELVDAPESDWPAAELSAVHFIFPNTVLVAGSADGKMLVRLFRLFPDDAPGLMQCRISVYGASQNHVDNATPPGFVDEARNIVTDEDYRVAVGAQANLAAAPVGFRVVYGRNEPGLQAFHLAVAAAIGAPPPCRPAPGRLCRAGG